MYIEKIDIESYGKLRNIHLTINSRMNVFFGGNESGKSTLASFIKFVLYGHAGTRMARVDSNEKRLYTPWNANKTSGSLVVYHKDRRYRIEREVAERERVRILDLSNNTAVYDGMEPGEVFFRMGEEVFAKTAFIRQIDPSETGGDKLAASIQNILFTADEELNSSKALAKLNEARNLLYNRSRSGGMLFELGKKRDSLREVLDQSLSGQRELLTMEGQIKELEEKIHSNNAKSVELKDELENYKAYTASQELQRIEGTRRQAEELKKSYDRIVAQNRAGDFVPDIEYARLLADSAIEVRAEHEKLSVLTGKREDAQKKYSECVEKSKSFDIISTAGGVDAVGGEYEVKKSRGRLYGTLTVIFLILAVLSSAAAVLNVILSFTGMFMYFAPAPFAALLALFIFLRSSANKAVRRMVGSYGFDSEQDFAEALDDYPDTESRLETLRAELESCEALAVEGEKAYNVVLMGAKEHLRKWNRTPETDGTGGEDIQRIAAQALSAAEEIGKAKALYEKYDVMLGTMLEGVDEAELHTLASAARAPKYDKGQIGRELDFLTRANESMDSKGREIEKNVAALTAKLPAPAVLTSQLKFVEEKAADLSLKHGALELALEVLEESCDELKNSITPRLTDTAGRLFSAVTGGVYPELLVDTSLSLDVRSQSVTRDIEYLSAGTRDAAYMCLRIALLTLLYDGDYPPLFCDDSFTRLDNDRYAGMLRVLAEFSKRTQVFIFTCHEREIRFLQDIDCNIIKM